MNLNETAVVGDCMRLETIPKIETRRGSRDGKERRAARTSVATRRELTRKQITELLLENCLDCGRMAAIPHGAFAACKVARNEEKRAISMSAMEGKKPYKESAFNPRLSLESWELTPLKYNSKLMNSIWGLYNRYSVHNFKKNTDAEEGARGGVVAAIWTVILDKRSPAAVAAVAAATATEAPRIIGTRNGL